MKIKILKILLFLMGASQAQAQDLSLEKLINDALVDNPAVKALKAKISAAQASVDSVSKIADPMIGLSELNRGHKTLYWTIGQKIEFPQKYALKEDIQTVKFEALHQQLNQMQLDIRSKILTTYYSIYAIQKIKRLTENDLIKIKEFSRIAETKYAAGTAPIQDSMKAHFAQTQVEADLISLNQEEDSLQAAMRSLLNKDLDFKISHPPKDLPIPKIPTSRLENLKVDTQNSPTLKQKNLEIREATYLYSLAKWEYAPDFQFKYQGQIAGEPEDSHIVSFEMSVPLWFSSKSAGTKYASALKQSKEFELVDVTQNLSTKIDSLKSKVKNQSELLTIFKTSLLPQALTSFESSVDAYKSNSVSFLALLDSERSYLQVQVAYYRTLIQYISSFTNLESVIGYSLADLGGIDTI